VSAHGHIAPYAVRVGAGLTARLPNRRSICERIVWLAFGSSSSRIRIAGDIRVAFRLGAIPTVGAGPALNWHHRPAITRHRYGDIEGSNRRSGRLHVDQPA